MTILMVLVELVVDTVVVMTMLLGAGVIAGGAALATTIAAVRRTADISAAAEYLRFKGF